MSEVVEEGKEEEGIVIQPVEEGNTGGEEVGVIELPLVPEGFDPELHVLLDESKPMSGYMIKSKELVPEPIRSITIGAMQSRFSIAEEVAIVEGEDSIAKVLRDRLMNSKYVNLDDTELTEGVGYLVNYLDTIGVLYLEVDASTRLDQLLQDGTEAEKY